MSAYLRSKYSQRVLGKWRPFELARMKRQGGRPWPGWVGDKDQRRLRWKRWRKLPDSARNLYRLIRSRFAV